MTINIRDLARTLNLSITTVSRALDGYSDVAESTRQRVIRAAQEVGYHPTSAARQLRRKRSDAIGYILPTSSPRFSDPFYANFLEGLCDQAAEQWIDLIVTSCPPESEYENAIYRRWCEGKKVDGFVLNRIRVDDSRVDFLLANKVPFVALGKTRNYSGYPCVLVDQKGGVARLVQHLAARGHQHIAFIGGSPELAIQVERFTGYKQGLKRTGLSLDERLILQGDLTEDGGYRTGCDLFQSSYRPTAVIGVNDLTALGVLRAIRELGLVPGKDVAVAGFDGIKETEYSNPPLTTLSQPTYEIARMLAGMLIAKINGEELAEAQEHIAPKLILRASTGE